MRKVKTITKAIVGLMIASMPFSAEARQWSLKDGSPDKSGGKFFNSL